MLHIAVFPANIYMATNPTEAGVEITEADVVTESEAGAAAETGAPPEFGTTAFVEDPHPASRTTNTTPDATVRTHEP